METKVCIFMYILKYTCITIEFRVWCQFIKWGRYKTTCLVYRLDLFLCLMPNIAWLITINSIDSVCMFINFSFQVFNFYIFVYKMVNLLQLHAPLVFPWLMYLQKQNITTPQYWTKTFDSWTKRLQRKLIKISEQHYNF